MPENFNFQLFSVLLKDFGKNCKWLWITVIFTCLTEWLHILLYIHCWMMIALLTLGKIKKYNQKVNSMLKKYIDTLINNF